ncbi:MAG TPA: hypothetical protein VJX72_13440 [Candidatus Acidoferrum sp.]|nr:hypothetical protein [Candidatus Acidoferrum sp.]
MMTSSPGLPIHRRDDFTLGSELNGIENAQDFVEIAASGHGADEHDLDFFVRADDKNSTDGGIVRGSATSQVSPALARSRLYSLATLSMFFEDGTMGNGATDSAWQTWQARKRLLQS